MACYAFCPRTSGASRKTVTSVCSALLAQNTECDHHGRSLGVPGRMTRAQMCGQSGRFWLDGRLRDDGTEALYCLDHLRITISCVSIAGLTLLAVSCLLPQACLLGMLHIGLFIKLTLQPQV